MPAEADVGPADLEHGPGLAMSGGFALGGLIPSEALEQPVGLGPALVEVTDEPEAQEARQGALQVERAAGDGDA